MSSQMSSYFLVPNRLKLSIKPEVFSLRRNIKATDGVMDSNYCVAIQEAGNRMHVQKSLLSTLLKDK